MLSITNCFESKSISLSLSCKRYYRVEYINSFKKKENPCRFLCKYEKLKKLKLSYLSFSKNFTFGNHYYREQQEAERIASFKMFNLDNLLTFYPLSRYSLLFSFLFSSFSVSSVPVNFSKCSPTTLPFPSPGTCHPSHTYTSSGFKFTTHPFALYLAYKYISSLLLF